jgi:hypothetical protein
MTDLYVFGSGLILAWAATILTPKRVWRRLAMRNYRGLVISAGLGISLAVVSLVPGIVSDISAAVRGEHVSIRAVSFLGGCTLVFAGGLIDDLIGSGPRGIRAHLGAMLRGRLTTGTLKILLAVVASALIVFTGPSGIGRIAAGMILMPAFANLWNGFDVAPGRAAKFFILAAWVTVTFATYANGVLLRMLGATVFLGWLDLKERGMLGDSGSNLLGFTLAVSLYGLLSTGALIGLAVVGVALNLLAETVTLSTIISSVRPLRWFDELGRLRLERQGDQMHEDSEIE